MTDQPPVQRQAQIKGGRKIRHVVNCSQDQHDRLTTKARLEGVTVAKLLVDTALRDDIKPTRRVVFNELNTLRAMYYGAAFGEGAVSAQEAHAALLALAKWVDAS